MANKETYDAKEQTKMTMVSIAFRGRRLTVFMKLPLNQKGNPVLSRKDFDILARSVGANERGMTITFGG